MPERVLIVSRLKSARTRSFRRATYGSYRQTRCNRRAARRSGWRRFGGWSRVAAPDQSASTSRRSSSVSQSGSASHRCCVGHRAPIRVGAVHLSDRQRRVRVPPARCHMKGRRARARTGSTGRCAYSVLIGNKVRRTAAGVPAWRTAAGVGRTVVGATIEAPNDVAHRKQPISSLCRREFRIP
jgi:hypothetical protein